jgi:hypothetical protein
LRLDRARIMGIVNVTPDSFSDGGEHADTDAAVAHALRWRRRARTCSTSAANRRGRAPAKCRSRRNCAASCR